MKIGFINNFGNYPPKGGSSVHVYQLVKGFIDEGHTVCALQGDYPFELFKRYGKSELSRFLKDIGVLYLRIGGGLRQDVYSFLKLRRSDLPLVWEINAPAFERQNFKSGIIELSWKVMAGLVDAAVCVSEEMGTYAKNDLHVRNTKVIPNGSDPSLFCPSRRNRKILPSIKDDDFVVFWGGSAQFMWQGIDIIFDVAKRFEKIEKRVKFVLITNPSHIRKSMTSNMHIIDQVPYLSIPEYIASADLCLCLYRKYGWSRLGFYGSALKLFDYMSCARPIIASRMGQIGRVIKNNENGLLTDNDVDDIVQKILFIKNNREKATEMGQKARADIINKYNWKNVARETIDLFEEVIGARKVKTGACSC